MSHPPQIFFWFFIRIHCSCSQSKPRLFERDIFQVEYKHMVMDHHRDTDPGMGQLLYHA